MNNKYIIIIISILIVFTGCSHQLKLTNSDEYYASTPYIDRQLTFGVLTPQSMEIEMLVSEVVDNLRSIGNIKIIYPYASSKGNPVDYVLDLNIQTKYQGDGMNFLISFPGFLVFAPWWSGYNYKAVINTKVTITDYKTNNSIMTQNYQTEYRCKQSEFDRTWTQGLDWLVTYGVASLIGGMVFTKYDEDITTDFIKSYSQPYSSYIARKIGAVINSL